jgi:hypothetical protein
LSGQAPAAARAAATRKPPPPKRPADRVLQLELGNKAK